MRISHPSLSPSRGDMFSSPPNESRHEQQEHDDADDDTGDGASAQTVAARECGVAWLSRWDRVGTGLDVDVVWIACTVDELTES